MPSAHTWSIAKDQNLVSIPQKRIIIHSQNIPASLLSFSPHFPYIFLLLNEFYMEHAQKLEEVRSVLKEVGEDTLEALLMIDAIQRLGIDYHFHGEIEVVLQRLHTKFNTVSDCHNNLYELALGFRLLRQEGYYVSADVFNNLKDTEESFKKNYFAAIYKGEDILEEIGNFSSQLLNAWNTHNDHSQARIVRNTLGHPHHKSLARFMAKSFLSDFQGTDGWVNVFRELAKWISIWWKDLGLAKELKFARNQPLKWYMWPLAVLPDPSLSEQRWEYAAVEQLPDYMKICFNALNGITNEISSKVYNDHGWNPMESLRKAWACLCNAFLVEAKWFADVHVPKADEYLKNGVISSGVHVVLVHMFFLLGHGITKRNVDIVDDFPEIISSVAKILRLWDDLGSAKTWKSLNNECLAPNPFSTCFTNACLNVARMVPLMYSYDDNRCLPSLEEHMKSLVYESVSS
ncbi:hypothetical protein AAG906_028872 [Vitis piasezkii]